MAIFDVQHISSHCFRSSRRRAAIEKKEFEMRKMRAELHQLRSSPTKVEKEIYVVVEKVVEVPVEKVISVEKVVEGGFTEVDMAKAFQKGTEAATTAKDELAEAMLRKVKQLTSEYEEKLEASATRELKFKELLKKQFELQKGTPVEVPHAGSAAKLQVEFEKMKEMLKDKMNSIVSLQERIKGYEDRLEEEFEKTRLQTHISEMAGVEVPRSAVDEIVKQLGAAGEQVDQENLDALFDCHVLDIWKRTYDTFVFELAKAIGGTVSEAQSNGSFRGDGWSDDDEGSEDDDAVLDNDPTFTNYERENG